MANDFLDKYKAKGSDDLETIVQQAPTAPAAPAESDAPTESVASAAPAASQNTPITPASLRFEQDETNGFTPPAHIAAPAPAYAAPSHAGVMGKTVLGVPVVYIGAALAAVLAIVLAVFLLGRGKEVPAMAGWSTSEAELWVGENNVNMRVEKLYSDELSAGTILSQTPAAGERVGKSEFLTITVSDGPDLSTMVPVPDIMSMTMAEVEAWADDNFMTTVRITTQTSETIASGKVISFTINDNTVLADEIRRDTPFYVIFSKGKPAGEAVEVPNFLTMSVAEAEAFALEKELLLVKEEEFSETIAEGNVIRQDIKAGETVYSGDSITLVVSKGKEILVPNFGDLSRELAAATANGLGIQTLVEECYSAKEKDVLISQSIAAGALYQQDDIVVLTYSLGNSFMITSFVGQNETEVYAWRDALNADGASVQLTVTYTESAAALGTVLDQSHENVKIGIDAHVYIIASAGTPVTVPNFVQPSGKGYDEIITKAEVIATCEALGIVPYFEEEAKSGRLPGEVWAQSVAAGAELLQGQPIVIKVVPVSEAATVSVPNFVGQTLAGAKATKNYGKFAITYQDASGAPLAESQIGSADTISAQSVAASSKVKEGYAIVLTVQEAVVPTPVPTPEPTPEPTPTPEPVAAVPNFKGLTYQEALAANNGKFNLKYEDANGIELKMPDAVQSGDGYAVSAQSVPAYGDMPEGTIIVLTITETTTETTSETGTETA